RRPRRWCSSWPASSRRYHCAAAPPAPSRPPRRPPSSWAESSPARTSAAAPGPLSWPGRGCVQLVQAPPGGGGSDSPVGDGLENLDRGGAAVRHGVCRGLADLLAGDGAAQRGAGGIDVDRRPALLARGEQEGDLVVVAVEADGHRHPRADHAVGPRRLPDLGVLQDVLDLVNAGLLLALLLLGRVIPTVLAQVALVAGSIDLVRDLHSPWPREMIQLGLQPVVCLLGKPGDVVVACLGHGYSLAAGRTVKVHRSPARAPRGNS